MLNWVQRFNIFCLLDNHHYKVGPNSYEYVLAAGAASSVDATTGNFNTVDSFLKNKWVFGHLCYEFGYSFQQMAMDKTDRIGFPLFFFFQPQIVLFIKDDTLHIECANADEVYSSIINEKDQVSLEKFNLQMQQRLTKHNYLTKIKTLQQHIQKGDCYEINFCQEFFAEDCMIDPATAYHQLSFLSPTPFSAFYKWKGRYLICASPERFLVKKGSKLFSQPMKGTAKRISNDKILDEQAKTALYLSAKDRAENVMIVDLVRNDLSKICKESSVKVDELYGVYTYPNVHQMISTVSGELKKKICFSEIIAATFPMGSMTGAPKKRVMQLIDRYEENRRGIFSGSVGYITPQGDFDFNVVIRSIMYNAQDRYLSYQVGSGITFYSDAEKEWEECLLKGQSMKKVLTS